MIDKDLLIKLNAQQLLMRVLRYNRLVMLGVPTPVRASEIRMILESLCKAIDETDAVSSSQEDPSHKDFIDQELVKKWSKYADEMFEGSDEETLDEFKFRIYSSLAPEIDEINKVINFNKECDELERLHEKYGVTDLGYYRFNKMSDELDEDMD